MSASYRTFIGGIEIRVTSPSPLAPLENFRYREFAETPPTHASTDLLPITIRLSEPSTTGLNCLFDSGEAWSVWAGGDRRCIAMRPPNLARPLWTAAFPLDVASCEVCLDDAYRNRATPGAPYVNPATYPLDMNLIMYRLAAGQGVIVHASGAVIDGRGWIFAGRSGSGKSTIVRQVMTRQGEAACISEDRIIVRGGPSPLQYGSPWLGEGGLCFNRRHRLDCIGFPVKSRGNGLRRLTPSEALDRLLPAVAIPWFDQVVLESPLKYLGDLVERLPAWEVEFALDGGIAPIIERESRAQV